MANSVFTATTQFLRRLAGGAPGTPAAGLLAGQPFHNEQENVVYIGIGDNGARADGARLALGTKAIGGVGAFLDLASAQVVAGKKTFSLSPAVPNGVSASDAAAFGQIAAALANYAQLASPTFSGQPTVPTPAAGDSSQLIPNTGWVQALLSAVMQGWQTKATAAAATTAALPAYAYANGSSGVGATLTASANGAFPVIDAGYTAAVNDVILVKSETGSAQAYNGEYVITSLGSSSTPWKLTRHVDMDASTEFSGSLVPVSGAGQTNANSIWLCNPSGTVTVGTTAIPFTQLNSATQLLAPATGGLAISGNSIAILGYAATATGSILVKTATGLAAAVPGTDYVAPFTTIDPGTA